MQVQPYLFFDGRCEEAIEFYRRALRAEVTMLMRFKDSPEPQPPGMIPPGSENNPLCNPIPTVPEPGVLALIGLALSGMAAMRRRKQS